MAGANVDVRSTSIRRYLLEVDLDGVEIDLDQLVSRFWIVVKSDETQFGEAVDLADKGPAGNVVVGAPDIGRPDKVHQPDPR